MLCFHKPFKFYMHSVSSAHSFVNCYLCEAGKGLIIFSSRRNCKKVVNYDFLGQGHGISNNHQDFGVHDSRCFSLQTVLA